MGKRTSLYFKINLLEVIQELHPQPQKINHLLDNLLDVNYKLIRVDKGLENIDEITAPYMEDEESLMLETSFNDEELDEEEESY